MVIHNEISGIFPDYFPNNFEDKIISIGAEKKEIEVYRLGLYGNNNREAFQPTYYDKMKKIKENEGKNTPPSFKRVVREFYKQRDNEDIGIYSTSCFFEIKDALHVKDLTLKKHYPEAILLKGKILCSDGLSHLTIKRKPTNLESHVDVWLYEDSNPQTNFKTVR